MAIDVRHPAALIGAHTPYAPTLAAARSESVGIRLTIRPLATAGVPIMPA
jgi:hypothetical protein